MKLLMIIGLFVSSSSFAEKTPCPGHLSSSDCRKQCVGGSRGGTYDAPTRTCTTNGLKKPSARPTLNYQKAANLQQAE